MKHVVLVGACYVDTILSVPHYPEQDSKLRATSLAVRRGGNCPNTLEVLEQLLAAHRDPEDDVGTHLVSPLPARSSPATGRILASFGPRARADFAHCLYRDACSEPASSYIIRSEATGSRTIVNHSCLPEMTAREFEGVVGAFVSHPDSWWHFEGRIPETTLACIRLLRNRLPAARISVELEKPGRQGLTELAAEADVVFYSRSWAESRGHQSAEACLTGEQRRQRSLGLCTWGADGAAAMSQPFGKCLCFPVEHQPGGISVVDSVGAGDTFIAGMLYGLVCREKTWPLDQSVRFAVNLATLKVQREGFEGLGADMMALATV
ncbi:hypothetical protein G6O67_003788 [Ophiocordyceps sinensis]|uniref:Carbohydrate kinase PfkB domain-containing protein n=1 Tax=Ophiocordyceps sinensis TaxID=72228 RepID=A0A8H4PSI4_9HYPO|nr:hypothetical protein G6O67_003788 [Ophiocordyceps sinensis]